MEKVHDIMTMEKVFIAQKILNLNSSEYNILNWLAIPADNRTYWQNGSIAEQAKEVIIESGMQPVNVSDEMYLDKSPEYWAGWAVSKRTG